jgi:ABC-type lipoprotein release transport system permease subunit
LNKLLSIGPDAHELVVLLQHDEDLDKVITSAQKMFPTLKIERWEDLSPETELMVNTVNQYAYIILIIIMLALAFGIVNTMLMAILERTRELGMLLALGMNKGKLFFLILSETIFLTLVGCPFGLVISWFVINYFNGKGIDLSIFGDEMM